MGSNKINGRIVLTCQYMSMLLQNHLHGNSHASRHHFSFVSSFEVQKILVKGVVGHIEIHWGYHWHDSSKMQECRIMSASPFAQTKNFTGSFGNCLAPHFLWYLWNKYRYKFVAGFCCRWLITCSGKWFSTTGFGMIFFGIHNGSNRGKNMSNIFSDMFNFFVSV